MLHISFKRSPAGPPFTKFITSADERKIFQKKDRRPTFFLKKKVTAHIISDIRGPVVVGVKPGVSEDLLRGDAAINVSVPHAVDEVQQMA